MTIYSNNFGKVFSGILKKSGISNYQISNYAHIDQAYLSRLKSGEKENPGPEILIRICLALVHLNSHVKIGDIETLFNATGRTLFHRSRQY